MYPSEIDNGTLPARKSIVRHFRASRPRFFFLFISTRKKKNLAELRDGRELRDNSEPAKISRLPIPESLIRRHVSAIASSRIIFRNFMRSPPFTLTPPSSPR